MAPNNLKIVPMDQNLSFPDPDKTPLRHFSFLISKASNISKMVHANSFFSCIDKNEDILENIFKNDEYKNKYQIKKPIRECMDCASIIISHENHINNNSSQPDIYTQYMSEGLNHNLAELILLLAGIINEKSTENHVDSFV
jgi:hypothetical protein